MLSRIPICSCLLLALYEKNELQVDEEKPNQLMILVSSDRGLCGGIHSSLAKATKAAIAEQPSGVNTMIVPCGDKARTILQKTHGRFHGRLFKVAQGIFQNLVVFKF